VLVVGCGVGTSACYLAARLQARVVGVDISPAMVRRSARRARKKGLTERAAFLVGSGTALPFDDGSFDVVLSESVNSFIPDRVRALSEYRRVAKPGGTVGMNECVWLESPPGDLAAYLERVTGARFMDAKGSWSRLLEQCGFDAVSEHIHRTGILEQWCSEVRQADAHEFVAAWGSFVRGFFSNAEYRSFARTALKVPASAGRMLRYFGYGIYVGYKPEVDAAGRR
jgi:ubiquinone/menaquinone biosynthesis C-methylase UbiE